MLRGKKQELPVKSRFISVHLRIRRQHSNCFQVETNVMVNSQDNYLRRNLNEALYFLTQLNTIFYVFDYNFLLLKCS